jgi:hypothetical protein
MAFGEEEDLAEWGWPLKPDLTNDRWGTRTWLSDQ